MIEKPSQVNSVPLSDQIHLITPCGAASQRNFLVS